jgi:hypothetical protein
MEKTDLVYYKDKNDGRIKSMGYVINSVLPYLNMPAMICGGNIPGKKNEKKLTIPVGLVVLKDAIMKKERQTTVFNSYISEEGGAEMLPEDLYKEFFAPEDNSNTKKRTTRKSRRAGGSRKTKKRNLN